MPKKNNNIGRFSNKEVYLRLLGELDGKIDSLNKGVEKHLEWAQTVFEKYAPLVEKQGVMLQKLSEELPDKGFCGKVDKIYQDLYPEGTEEPNVPQKVNLLWNDRRWMKGLLYFLVSIGVVDFILLIGRYIVMKNI